MNSLKAMLDQEAPTVRDVALNCLPPLINASHRDIHLLIALAADAAEAAGPVEPPPELVALAAEPGKRRANLGAKRLLATLTFTSDPEPQPPTP